MGSYTQEQIEYITDKLVVIAQAKEDICEYVKSFSDCKDCPLSQLNKCDNLNLPEFDFSHDRWLDD